MFISIIKQMLGLHQPQARQFKKSGCQLQEFPLIKLHIFSDIEILDLSDNLISDLNSLNHHMATAPHVLSKLKVVNLSKNQFPNVSSLLPLARAANGITSIDISCNPLVQNLNFLYQLALVFEKVRRVDCGYEVEIDQGVRERIVMQQMAGGRIIHNFMKAVEQSSIRAKSRSQLWEEQVMLEKMLKQQAQPTPVKSITEQNQHIFQIMDQFISFVLPSQSSSSNSPTYRSPQHPHYSSQEIQIKSQYEIANSPNGLLRYMTEGDDRQVDLTEFYYQQMVKKPSISGKLLQEIQVEESVLIQIQEGRREVSSEELLKQMRRKWTNNYIITSQLKPDIASHHASLHSPFKSIQTDITSHQAPLLSSHTNSIFFGFDREWTHETHIYLKHRLMSLLRATLKAVPVQKESERTFQENYTSPYHQNTISSPQEIIPSSTFSSQNDQNYQTFGLSFEFPLPFKEKTLSSPKSRNKFIIGSLINVLQSILKRIVLRRILNARFIQQNDILDFSQAIKRIAKRKQELSFRKIYEAAVFYKCLQGRMEAFKTKLVFKAWRQLKKRKMKLLKSLLLRKNKKQVAFLSVFFTQMRLNSRNLGFQKRLQRTRAEMLSQPNELQDVSCILKRSATCQKTILFPQKQKDSDRTLQARRNCLKRSIK